jgi:hypothetical protein
MKELRRRAQHIPKAAHSCHLRSQARKVGIVHQLKAARIALLLSMIRGQLRQLSPEETVNRMPSTDTQLVPQRAIGQRSKVFLFLSFADPVWKRMLFQELTDPLNDQVLQPDHQKLHLLALTDCIH